MTLQADYLIIGTGAMGMAFADILITETDATIVMVDRYAKPGGHWNVAYPFVTLHQPSQFYGVSSKELSRGTIDQIGWNKGLNDLASGAQVSAYFDEVMRDQFLPSGRVQYFPMCEYRGDNKFTSIITGEEHEVKVHKKIVNCTYFKTEVPATHTPNFSVAEGVQFMPLNNLPKIKNAPAGFVIIGGGKTGIDAILWLLQNNVAPDKITWIISRDAWLIDRKNTQPTDAFFGDTIGAQAAQFEAVANAISIPDLFDRLESSGVLLRIDRTVRPQMFHGATISQMELEQMRRVKNVIRMGRVQSIQKDQIVFKDGSIATSPDHIHVDCSATPIKSDLKKTSIFDGNVITPQTVRSYQPIFSAAFIAHIEATMDDEKEKNRLCGIVPLPDHDTDWLRMLAAMMMNQFNWSQNKELRHWLKENRLDGFSKMVSKVSKDETEKMAILTKMRDHSMPAIMNLQKLIGELDAQTDEAYERPQFQVRKDMFFKGTLAETPQSAHTLEEGELLVKVDQFAFTSNNITYAVAGDFLGYWQFFPPVGTDSDGWGVIPVWGFADVVESKVDGIPVGDRFFGYFPPASHLKMKPNRLSDQQFIEGSEHRAKLPQGYNLYRRVLAEPGYDTSFDQARALLYPLYLTSYSIVGSVEDDSYYEAEQILILSASSKTSIGCGYAFKALNNVPKTIGVTSSAHVDSIRKLGLYDETISYDDVFNLDPSKATLIIDMSGNSGLLVKLHQHFGDQMKKTINVGLTHWTNAMPQKGINTERSTQFFAPTYVQRKAKEWGYQTFSEKTNAFITEAAAKTSKWLTFRTIDGLKGMAAIHQDVCDGNIPPNEGLIVKM